MSIFKKRREFIVDESLVTTLVRDINRRCEIFDYTIGNCGWADEPTSWFVSFYADNKTYGKIVKSLMNIGEFKKVRRPRRKTDLYFVKAL